MPNNNPPTGSTTFIRAGFGFDVGQNFGRTKVDTPIELAEGEYAKPGFVIGYIAEDPKSNLGFLRIGTNGRVRVHVLRTALGSPPATADANA